MKFENVQIQAVKKNSQLADKLLRFVENCSWYDAKDHIASNVRNWVYTDWETIFVAMCNETIVGMTSFMKTDYYPLPEIYPWVSGVFVSEEYRGYRISEKMIEYANQYAESIGFERTYIPSEFFGLYEKYGYTYVKDIVNYGNGVDHLFVKTLKSRNLNY